MPAPRPTTNSSSNTTSSPSECRHRPEDIWTNPVFQDILVVGVRWALGQAQAEVPPNLKEVAHGALTNPPYVEPQPPATAKTK